MATSEAESFTPEIFLYDAFNNAHGGLTQALKALDKLARLNVLAQRGIRADDCLVGDEELLIELASAVHAAALHAHHMWSEGLPKEGGA